MKEEKGSYLMDLLVNLETSLGGLLKTRTTYHKTMQDIVCVYTHNLGLTPIVGCDGLQIIGCRVNR